jgi:hypothetical protein
MGTRFLLSPDAYFGDVWFAREQRKLFAHSWHLAAATDELAEPGDFVTIDAGFDPLVVVRNSLGAAGVTLFLGAMYVIINTGVEVLQGVADPRLRV